VNSIESRVIPPATQPSTPAAYPRSAGTDIVGSTTLFGITPAGVVEQLDMTAPDPVPPVRSLDTQHRLRTGVASTRNEFLYLLSRGPQSSSSFLPSLRIVNLTTFQAAGSIDFPATSIPSALALTPDGKYLYVAGALTAQVFTDPSGVDCHVVDMSTRTIVKTLRFPGSLPRPEIVMCPDGGRVFLTTSAGIAVIDVLTQTLSHTITGSEFFQWPGASAHIAINPRGTMLFAAPVWAPVTRGGVGVYDTATSVQVQHIPIDSLQTMTIAVSVDGRYLCIDHIVPDPVTKLNDFPSIELIRLPEGKLIATRLWSGPRNVPLTVGQLVPVPAPGT